jgi:putative 4-mercaptohistidine N1-methyltranferase
MCEIIDMPLSWPVDVNALEAMAYCRWLGERDGCDYKLLSEAQWHRLYDVAGIKDVPEFDDKRANINFAHYSSSTPVDRFAFGDIYDVMGNVWQWTRTPIYGFKGFEVHPVYDDFSTPTFDNKHNIIKGGSWATSGNELMRYSRYAFRRHFYQHAGFRYVKGVADTQESDVYESDKAVSLDCEFNYGDTHFAIENFAKKCASLADRYAINRKSALHLGCATGRSCFELARYFESVTGIDFSARFIQMGVTLQKRGEIFYKREEEGDIISYHSHSLKEFDLEKYADKVQFWQGDSCNLKEHFRDYDMIISTNLDHLYEPKLFLESIHKRLNDNGILILISPYLWQEQYTKREFWLGGYVDENDKEVSSFETLKEILQEHLTLLDSQEIESVIRKKARDFQHLISHVSVWRKDV